VVRRLGVASLVGAEGRCRRVTAVAVAGRRVIAVVFGPCVARSADGGADHHARKPGALVTGLAAAHRRRDRGVPGDVERRARDIRVADLEAVRIDIGRRVAARAAAIEVAGREVGRAARPAGDRDHVRRRRTKELASAQRPSARTMALVAGGLTLVHTYDVVDGEVTRGRVTLSAHHARGGYMVRRYRRGARCQCLGAAQLVGAKGRRGHVAGAAVTGRGVVGVQRRVRTRVTGGSAARDHAGGGRRLVTGCAERDHRFHRGVTGRIQRGAGDGAGGRRLADSDLETSCRATVGDVAARGVAVERPDRADRDVVDGRRRDHRDVLERRVDIRGVAGVAGGHARVHGGDRVLRVVVRRQVTGRARRLRRVDRRRDRNVIGGQRSARHIVCEGRCGRVTAAALGCCRLRRVIRIVRHRARVTPGT